MASKVTPVLILIREILYVFQFYVFYKGFDDTKSLRFNTDTHNLISASILNLILIATH